MQVTVDSGTYRPFQVTFETDLEGKGILAILNLCLAHIQEGVNLPTNAGQIATFSQQNKAAIKNATGG